jgi:putative phosphoribosyl transferase
MEMTAIQFKDRLEAGLLLSKKLKQYQNKDIVVYALPRGGVVTGFEIAKYLNAPLDLIITRKIGHPFQPEYAVAAITESGQIVGDSKILTTIDEEWLEDAVEAERKEAARRRKKYLRTRPVFSPAEKIAIVVDDGVATGLTLLAAIKSLRKYNPQKIVVAVPVLPYSVAKKLEKEVDSLVALHTPNDDEFLGAVGGYYNDFSQTEDKEVMYLLKKNQHLISINKDLKTFAIRHEKAESFFIDRQ